MESEKRGRRNVSWYHVVQRCIDGKMILQYLKYLELIINDGGITQQ